MHHRTSYSITAVIAMVLFVLTLPFAPTGYAQDAEPTSIPVLPDATEESAAPVAPDIAPPSVDDAEPIAEVTAEPQPTEGAGDDTPVTDAAPAVDTCPVGIQDSFTAAEILCEGLGSGEACIGNGTVDATFGGDVEGNFSQAGDRVSVSSLDRVELTSSGTWTIIRLAPELATTDGGDIASPVVFAYGNVALTDTGRVQSGAGQSGTVVAQRGLNVRRAPGNEGVVVWQLSGGQEITVTGISADREWIRMVIPNEFAGTGWVYAPYINVEGGTETLDVVNENSPVPDLTPPEFAPGQSYELLSSPTPDDCAIGIPRSGLLIQSPNGLPDAIRLEINQAELQISGTVFVEALVGETLNISVLEGTTTVLANNGQAIANAGERITISMDVNLVVNGSPESNTFDPDSLPNLPVRLLPRQFDLSRSVIDTEPVTEAETDTEAVTFGTPQATDAPITEAVSCTLTAPDEVRNIRAGASTLFDVVQVLQPNETIEADGQALGELNLTWFRTVNDGWIRIDTVETSDGCGALPTVETPALPEPTATPVTEAGQLSASTLADLVCDGTTSITGSVTSDGVETSVAIGGTWTASAGTTATFTTQGGLLRPEFGAYIKLFAENGTEIASSDDGRSLTLTFESDTTFTARFSAANGDTVVMAASCS